MKKILFASTALFAVGAASQAFSAEPVTASVGGYAFGGLGFADGQDGVGVMRDGEIHFKAMGTSDNGLTFGAHVELEAFTSGDQIDENYVYVSGSFGQIKFGGDDSAKEAYVNGILFSPGARIAYWYGFNDVNPAALDGNLAYWGSRQGASDSVGVHYDSPNFNGFQVGATYQPRQNSDGGGDTNATVFDNGTGDFQNVWALGAVYENQFEGFGFGVSGAVQDGDGFGEMAWHVGGNVSASGFTVAAQYASFENEDTAISVGLRYATGPWTIAGGYTWGEVDASDLDQSLAAAWVTYALAPGVSATVGLEYGDDDDGEDGIGGLAYLALSF